MPSAELIAIGTELLLGEIQDTNSRFLARQLRDLGVDVFRTTNIGDNTARIASAVNEALERVDIVITTGGLGPTVDDPTRDAIALAFNAPSVFHSEIWSVVEKRFLRRGVTPTENNKRQAFLPQGASIISNPVGTAPAFSIHRDKKVVFCLPGVPKEMEYIALESVFPLIKQEFDLHSLIKVRVVHLAGVGESVVDQPLADFERKANPTVGLVAYPGLVDIRITAKAADVRTADKMIAEVESDIVPLFSEDIYGFDDMTLAQSIINILENNGVRVYIYSHGLGNKWPPEFTTNPGVLLTYGDQPFDFDALPEENHLNNTVHFFCNYSEEAGESCLVYSLQFSALTQQSALLYNGPQAQGATWAINRAMDIIRRCLKPHLK